MHSRRSSYLSSTSLDGTRSHNQVPSLNDFPALPSGKESAIVVDRIESGATLEVDVNHQAASPGSHEQDRRERMHAGDGMPGPSLEPDHLEHISVTGTGPTGALTASPTAVSGESTSQPTAMVSIGAMPEELPATWSCAYVNLSQQENRSADSGSGRVPRKLKKRRTRPRGRTLSWTATMTGGLSELVAGRSFADAAQAR